MLKRSWPVVAAGALLLAALAMTVTARAEELPFSVEAPSYILVDAASGQAVCEFNADQKLDLAGAVKVMSALVLARERDEGRLPDDAEVPVSRGAASSGGMSAFLAGGDSYSASTLIKAMMMISANDACAALAEFTAGSGEGFVLKMNELALELGICPIFVNPTGHNASGQAMSVREAAAVACALTEYPDMLAFSGTYMDTLVHEGGRETELVNPNRLVRFYTGCDGLATGSNQQAGYSGVFTAERDGQRFVAVVAGCKNSKERFDAAQKLMDYGFANFQSVTAIEEGKGVCRDVPVLGGSRTAVHGVAAHSQSVLMKKGAKLEKEAVLAKEAFDAPVERGDVLGELVIKVDGVKACTVPIVAYEAVEKASIVNNFKKAACDFIGARAAEE